VNSKATLRVPLEDLLPRIPPLFHDAIRNSRYYASKSDSLLIQADDSRMQAENEQHCFTRLYEEIVRAGSQTLPGETSPEQRQLVKDLQKAENERRIKAKKHHSSKKSSRRARPEE
jgi:peptidyl-tRNA hydrolase ICT1